MGPSDPGLGDPANSAGFRAPQRFRIAANCTFPGAFQGRTGGYSGGNSG